MLFLSLWPNSPTRDKAASFLRFLDHIHWHATVGRTSLDEGSARRRDLCLTTLTKETSMPPPRFVYSFFFFLCTCFFVLIVLAMPFVLTVQHTQHKHPCPRRDSNSQPQQASGHRPTPKPRGQRDRSGIRTRNSSKRSATGVGAQINKASSDWSIWTQIFKRLAALIRIFHGMFLMTSFAVWPYRYKVYLLHFLYIVKIDYC